MEDKKVLIQSIVDKLNGMSYKHLRLAWIAVDAISKAKEKKHE